MGQSSWSRAKKNELRSGMVLRQRGLRPITHNNSFFIVAEEKKKKTSAAPPAIQSSQWMNWRAVLCLAALRSSLVRHSIDLFHWRVAFIQSINWFHFINPFHSTNQLRSLSLFTHQSAKLLNQLNEFNCFLNSLKLMEGSTHSLQSKLNKFNLLGSLAPLKLPPVMLLYHSCC